MLRLAAATTLFHCRSLVTETVLTYEVFGSFQINRINTMSQWRDQDDQKADHDNASHGNGQNNQRNYNDDDTWQTMLFIDNK